MDTNTERRIWHYDSGNRPRGPYTESEIEGRIADGEVTAQTLVWSHPMEEWLPAAAVGPFKARFAKGDPVLDDPTVPAGPGFVYVSQVRPWTRFFARHLDYSTFLLIAMAVVVFTSSDPLALLRTRPINITLAFIALYFIWVPIEALLVSVYGTTPGKYLLGVHITDESGKPPSFGASLKRSFLVWVKGMGLTLSIVSIIAQILGYTNLRRYHVSSWDKSSGTTVEHYDYHILSPIFYYLTISALMFLVVVFGMTMGR